MFRKLLGLGALAIAVGNSAVAAAQQSVDSTLNVAMTVVAACSVSATNLTFAATPVGSAAQGQATIQVNCAAAVPYVVALDEGLQSDVLLGGRTVRRMADGNLNHILYSLHQSAGSTIDWGDRGYGNTLDAPAYSGTGTGTTQSITVYGSTGPGVTPGTYTDTVKVTVHY